MSDFNPGMARFRLTERRAAWLACILLATLVGAVFQPTLECGFINYDDGDYVTDNPKVAAGLSVRGIVWAFTQVHASNWHPLTWISHAADCQLYGLNPAGHHLTNILLHGITTILLFLVLRQMTGAFWRSAFAAAVFAVHPLRVESVAWISERKDVLSGLLFMLTIGAYAKYVSGSRFQVPGSGSVAKREDHVSRLAHHDDESDSSIPGPQVWYGCALAIFALGLMSKPMLVTLPFVLLLLDYWPLGRFAIGDSRSAVRPWTSLLWPLIREKLPFLLLSVASGAITLIAQQEAMTRVPLALRIGNALVSCIAYLRQLIWPSDLALAYPIPVHGIGMANVILSGALIAALSAAAFALRRHGYVLAGWLWYLVMLLPVSGILQVGVQARADRYTYLPQIGLGLLLTWGVADLCAGWRRRRLILAGSSAAVLTALTFFSRSQVSYWRSSEALWTRALVCNPENFVAHNNLGNALLQQERVDEAIVHLRKGLQIRPGFSKALNNLGYALLQKGALDEAIARLEEAVRSNADDVEARNNLGKALFRKGRISEAVVHFQRAAQLRPDFADVQNNLGNALLESGRTEAAVARFQTALALNPKDAQARNNLGLALTRQGRPREALAHLSEALRLNPGHFEAENNLGNALFQMGEVDEAIVHFHRTLRLKPDHEEARYNLGNACFQSGRVDEAIGHYREALRLNPDDPEAHNNLGNALLQKGNDADAAAEFERALEIRRDYPEAQNGLAWVLATSAQDSLRDGHRALVLARQAERLIGGSHPIIQRTLAAACAEAGQFPEARRRAEEAIKLAQAAGRTDMTMALRNESNLYASRHPFHR